MRDFKTYRAHRRNLWHVTKPLEPWQSTLKAESKRRYVVRDGKTYQPNGARERERRMLQILGDA